MSRLARVRTEDRNIERLQDEIEKALLIPDARTIVTASLKAAEHNRVSHTLGRRFTGWKVVRKDAASDVWDAAVNTTPDLTLVLDCSADVSVSIEVF